MKKKTDTTKERLDKLEEVIGTLTPKNENTNKIEKFAYIDY